MAVLIAVVASVAAISDRIRRRLVPRALRSTGRVTRLARRERRAALFRSCLSAAIVTDGSHVTEI